MEVQPSHVSAFTRFSDKLKSTTRRKPSTNQAIPQDLIQYPQDMERRRSSVANYAAAIRQIFISSPSQSQDLSALVTALPTELLTQIFLYLDIWTLLNCQLVCKRWRELIPGTSPLLSEELYIAPSHNLAMYTSVSTAFELEILTHPHMPTGLKRGFPSAGEKWPWALTHRTKALVRMSSEILFHPVILDWDVFVPKLASKFEKEYVVGEGSKLYWESRKREFKQKDRKKESFEDMLVSMPPLQEIVLSPAWPTTEVDRLMLKAKEGKAGITLGDLMEAMEDWGADSGVQDMKPLD